MKIRLSYDLCQYDLHIADTRYHENEQAITNWQNISFGKKVNECQEDAFDKLTQEMRKDI